LDDKKQSQIKEDLLKASNAKGEKSKNANSGNISNQIKNKNIKEFIDLNNDDNVIKKEIKNEEMTKINYNIKQYLEILDTAENRNDSSEKIKYINGNSYDLDDSSRILNNVFISKNSHKIETHSNIMDNNKKRKLDKDIKQYELPLNEAEKQINESKNIIGIKLFCERDSASNLFKNLVNIL
jgi:hypothetical protein